MGPLFGGRRKRRPRPASPEVPRSGWMATDKATFSFSGPGLDENSIPPQKGHFRIGLDRSRAPIGAFRPTLEGFGNRNDTKRETNECSHRRRGQPLDSLAIPRGSRNVRGVREKQGQNIAPQLSMTRSRDPWAIIALFQMGQSSSLEAPPWAPLRSPRPDRRMGAAALGSALQGNGLFLQRCFGHLSEFFFAGLGQDLRRRGGGSAPWFADFPRFFGFRVSF